LATEENAMTCVICKRGEVRAKKVEAEIKIGNDHLLVTVDAEACTQCGEAYYSADIMRRLEQVREDFVRKAITPPAVGRVYQLT
jgi:YgiT-type zinc finger domain-containing protein